jgi:mannose-6-phosphate isomerase-like protein (cupin superfamily)
MTAAILRATGLSVLLLVSLVARGDFKRAKVDEGQYFSAAQLAAEVAHPVDGLDFKTVSTSPESTILIARRDKTGEVEVHGTLDDILLVESGRATVTVGGRVTGNRQTEANEWRGGEQSGGREYAVAAGDLLLIPAGSPHLVTVAANASFTYLIVKTPAQHPLTTSNGR